jgi:hypothetical protein
MIESYKIAVHLKAPTRYKMLKKKCHSASFSKGAYLSASELRHQTLIKISKAWES